jgi:hypothetical protein
VAWSLESLASRRVTSGSRDGYGSRPCPVPPGLAIALGPLRLGTGGVTVKMRRAGRRMSSGRAQDASSCLVLGGGTPRGAPRLLPCPHGDQPALTCLPLVRRDAICRAEALLFLRCTDVRQERGLRSHADPAEAPAPLMRRRGARRHQTQGGPHGGGDALRWKGARGQAAHQGSQPCPARLCHSDQAGTAPPRGHDHGGRRRGARRGAQHDVCRGSSPGILGRTARPRLSCTTAPRGTPGWQGPRRIVAARLGPAGSP